MAAADYILCDKCYGKIVYDTDDIIFEALVKLGFSGLPIRCGRCSDKDNLMFSYQFGGEEEQTVRPCWKMRYTASSTRSWNYEKGRDVCPSLTVSESSN